MRSEDRTTGENTEQCATYITVIPAQHPQTLHGSFMCLSSCAQVRFVKLSVNLWFEVRTGLNVTNDEI